VTLQNGFDDGAIDLAMWDVHLTSGTTVAETNGLLEVALPPMPQKYMYGMLRAKAASNLAGCTVSVRVLDVPNQAATTSWASLSLRIDPANYIEVVVYGKMLTFKSIVGGTHLPHYADFTYIPAEHAHWRIREAAGITYWEASPDGKNWKYMAQAPNPLPVDAMHVAVAGGTDEASMEILGSARFDDLVVGP
jgi:hypothetical protein